MNLCIDLGDSSYTLKFKVLDTPIAQLWVERMYLSLPDNVDHPTRFYGFNSIEAELERAEQQLKESVQVINAHDPIIHKPVDIHSQDCLNYLHNIFEVYHGLLDQQTHPYWVSAPDPVRKALAELNLNVHRAESATRHPKPRFVGTYYRLPKTETLTPELMNTYGEISARFGVVYLNYVEIGKTLEDLMEDDDQYIGEDAFQPFNHYSSDFVVRMFDVPQSDMDKKINKMEQYYNKNKDFFVSKGYSEFNNPSLLPLKFPVAELIITKDRTQIIADISARQRIARVYFE
jgi:hypothetical protein